jgi:hypothetical protein
MLAEASDHIKPRFSRTIQDASTSPTPSNVDLIAKDVTKIPPGLNAQKTAWMQQLLNPTIRISRTTIQIFRTLGWHIQYEMKSEDEDSSYYFKDVVKYFAAYTDAMKTVRDKAAKRSCSNKAQMMTDIGEQ